MSMIYHIEVIAPAAGVDAVIGAASDAAGVELGWSGSLESVEALCVAARLIYPGQAMVDLLLSAHWGRLVVCTPEFGRWWRARPMAAMPVADCTVEVRR